MEVVNKKIGMYLLLGGGATWEITKSELKLATYKNSPDPTNWHTKMTGVKSFWKRNNLELFGLDLGLKVSLVISISPQIWYSPRWRHPQEADPFKFLKIFLLTTSIYESSKNFMRIRLKLKEIFIWKFWAELSGGPFTYRQYNRF